MARPKLNMTKSQFDRECPPLYGTWLISKLGPTQAMKADATEVLARRDIRLNNRDVQGIPAMTLHERRTRRHAIIGGVLGASLLTLSFALGGCDDKTANASGFKTSEAAAQPDGIQESEEITAEQGQAMPETTYLGDITCKGSHAIKVTMEPSDNDTLARAATRVTGEPFREILPRERAEQFWKDREAKLGPPEDDRSFFIQPDCTGLTQGH
jgi:hypothetical protein